MKKIRFIILTVSLLFLAFGCIAAINYRNNYQEISCLLSDEELKRCNVSITDGNMTRGAVPTLTDLEMAAQEVLFIVPTQREVRGNDVLITASVTRVVKSKLDLQAGEVIWIYEPYGIRWDPNDPFSGKGVVYHSYNSPMCLEEEYLIFLSRREISDLYQYSEKDQRTFLYANQEVGSFSVKDRKTVMQIRRVPSSAAEVFRYTEGWDTVRINAYLRERMAAFTRKTYLWRTLEEYRFITDDQWGFSPDDETVQALEMLTEQVRKKYFE